MLNFRLEEVFTVHAQDRIPRRFLDPEQGHDAPRRSRRGRLRPRTEHNSPRSSSSLPVCWTRFFILPSAAGCGFIDSDAVAEFGDAAFGLSRGRGSTRGRDVLCPDGSRTASWRPTTSGRRVGSEKLGIPSPLPGCHIVGSWWWPHLSLIWQWYVLV